MTKNMFFRKIMSDGQPVFKSTTLVSEYYGFDTIGPVALMATVA